MKEYICLYNDEFVMIHCVKTKANHIDEAKNKFEVYLKTQAIRYIDTSKMLLIAPDYLQEI